MTHAEHILPLRTPVLFAGQTFAALVLKEPTAGQVDAVADLGSTASVIDLIFQVAAVPMGVASGLSARDFKAAWAWLTPFCADQTIPDPVPDALTITLKHPVTHDADTLFELALREPTAGELKKVEDLAGRAAMTQLIAEITGQPLAVIKRIAISDWKAAEAYLLGFI